MNTLLYSISDIERIADHAMAVAKAAQEIYEKKIEFSKPAKDELAVLVAATQEILNLTMSAISTGDLTVAAKVEPLEEVIDDLKEALRTRHSIRLSQGNCSIETGFVWSDLLTNLERIADHCSNIGSDIISRSFGSDYEAHEYLRNVHKDPNQSYSENYDRYMRKYFDTAKSFGN